MDKILGLSLIMMSSLAIADVTQSPYNTKPQQNVGTCSSEYDINCQKVNLSASQIRTAIKETIMSVLVDIDGTKEGCELSAPKENFILRSPQKAVLMFTLSGCGGGNHFETYLALTQQNMRWVHYYTVLIGNEREFLAREIYLQGDTLIVKGLIWGSEDAQCCPTQHLIKQFSIANKDVTEK